MKNEAKALGTKSTETTAIEAVTAWRAAREKVNVIRAESVKLARGLDRIDAHQREADLYEAEAACLRLEAVATAALEARDLEKGDEAASAMSLGFLLDKIRPLVERRAELRAEIASIERQVGEAYRASTAAYHAVSAQRGAADLPSPRAAVVSGAVEHAPTLEDLVVAYEGLLADPKHGLPALARALEFDERARGARSREHALRVEREIERREAEAKAAEAADARAERERKASAERAARAAEIQQEADAAAKEARIRNELLAADLQRTTRAG